MAELTMKNEPKWTLILSDRELRAIRCALGEMTQAGYPDGVMATAGRELYILLDDCLEA